MNILLAAPSSFKARGGTYYSVQHKLEQAFVRQGAMVETFSDRDIAKLHGLLGIRDLGVRRTNRDFLKYISNVEPDLLVLCHADIITSETLAEARKLRPTMRIAEVRVDPLFYPVTLSHLRARRGHADAMFVTTAGPALKLVGSKKSPACFIPNPADFSIENVSAHLHDNQPFDVVYTRRPGQGFQVTDYRRDVADVIAADPRIRFTQPGEGGAFGRDYIKLIASAKIGLNLSQAALAAVEGFTPTQLMHAYSSDRIGHFGGCGLALLIAKRFAMDAVMQEGKEFLAFDDAQDAHEKALWLINHPQERMALGTGAHAAFHQRFSAQQVADYIVAKTMRDALPNVAWPTEDFGE